jgi:hypothetical protein
MPAAAQRAEAAALAHAEVVVAQEIEQHQDVANRIVSSEIAVSRGEARLVLEFEGGRRSVFALRSGSAFIGDERLGDAPRGGDLDRSWRELLGAAMEANSDELPLLLAAWDAPGDGQFERRVREALEGVVPANLADQAVLAEAMALNAEAEAMQAEAEYDSVERLLERVERLRAQVRDLEELRDIPVHVAIEADRGRNFFNRGPLRHLFRGLSGIVSVALAYGVIFALAFIAIFFGGRRYIEGVADTARVATTRSLLVGMAASFLVIPAFILGAIALLISIVGILALPVWVMLFPIAVGLATVLGYIGVAHGLGESLAERRFHTSDWFQRGNSYYFLISGIGLLLAPFVAMNVVRMAGPWLGFFAGILTAVGVIVTWAALSIGLGAVLLSRGGTRPVRGAAADMEPEIYAEPTGA